MPQALDRSAPVFFIQVQPAGVATTQRPPVDIRVISLSFDEEEAKQDVITLTVDNHDLAAFESPMFAIGTKIITSWGYPGAMGKTREGSVTKVSGSLQLKVECKGKSHLANLIAKTRIFTNVRRCDVALQLATEHGQAAVATIDETPGVVMRPMSGAAWGGVVYSQITQSRMTDAAFLRDLAHREGYDYHEDVNGFHFHARRVGAAPIRTFTYFNDPKQGDVESFSVEGDVGAAPALVVGVGRDLDTKQSHTVVGGTKGAAVDAPTRLLNAKTGGYNAKALAAAVEILQGSQAAYNVEQLASGPKGELTPDQALPFLSMIAEAKADGRGGGIHVFASTGKTKAEDQAAANAGASRSQQKAVKVTLHCVGDALVEAKQVVTLKGFGRMLDGNYHVTSAKHVVGPGYKMTLKLAREGHGTNTNAPGTDGVVNKGVGPNASSKGVFVVPGSTGGVTFHPAGTPPKKA